MLQKKWTYARDDKLFDRTVKCKKAGRKQIVFSSSLKLNAMLQKCFS